jgi:hypothetical protein
MAELIRLNPLAPPEKWDRVAGWLVPGDNCTELEYRIVVRSAIDDGTLENPLGSNRGLRIEKWLRAAHVPESLISTGKGWWCAAWVGAVFRDAGARVPRDYASVDAWLPFLQKTPRPGSAIVYGVRGDGHHIGIVTRLSPLMLTREGNRAFGGISNNGVAVDQGPMNRKDVLGYVHAAPV